MEHGVGDWRVVRLIRKWPKAGVAEDGEVKPGAVGTPQEPDPIAELSALLARPHNADRWP